MKVVSGAVCIVRWVGEVDEPTESPGRVDLHFVA